MTYPEIKLVDAPTATANVLFDFNDITASPRREVEADDFSIGTPSLIGDVDAIDPLYGERVVSFTCRMRGTKAQVAAAQSALARQLLATGQGWLWVRMTASSRLLFFRTYRPEPGALSFDLVQTVSTTALENWTVEVDLPCEPFAYGERVTQSAQVITNNPTTGTNPLRIALPAITGDAPAPLRLALVSPSGASFRKFMVHAHAGATVRLPVSVGIGSGDGLTAGADTTAVTASGWVGGSYRNVTFATNANLAARVTGSFGSLAPGRYRAVLLMAGDPGATFQVRLDSYIAGAAKTIKTDSGSVWVDLGNVDLPPNRPATPADSGPSINPPFSILVGRTSASGAAQLDHLLLLPMSLIDTTEVRMLGANENFFYDGTRTRIFDGDSESSWLMTTSTGAQFFPPNTTPPALYGAFPRGIPGAQNVITLLRFYSQVDAVGAGDDTTATTTVTVSYLPRFLYIGDS